MADENACFVELQQQQNQQLVANNQEEDSEVDSQSESIAIQCCYDAETFITEMESYPCLWNVTTRSHHDSNIRNTAWQQLAKKFDKPGKHMICFQLGYS